MTSADKIAAAQQLCHLLLWDNPDQANDCFSDFEHVLADDPGDLYYALRSALEPVTALVDWNELDFMLRDLQRIAAAHQIPVRFADVDIEIDEEDPTDFFCAVHEALSERGFHLWLWETGMSMYCAFMARAEDRELLYRVAERLGFDEDSCSQMRCCEDIC